MYNILNICKRKDEGNVGIVKIWAFIFVKNCNQHKNIGTHFDKISLVKTLQKCILKGKINLLKSDKSSIERLRADLNHKNN
jgi:uncharacterized ferritin-like protein (DUF455 family)